MSLREISEKHFDWVDEMEWHNKTPLECIALIGSEVGAAADECRDILPTKKLGTKLADIILRTIDLAYEQGIDIDAAILEKMELNKKNGTRGRIK